MRNALGTGCLVLLGLFAGCASSVGEPAPPQHPLSLSEAMARAAWALAVPGSRRDAAQIFQALDLDMSSFTAATFDRSTTYRATGPSQVLTIRIAHTGITFAQTVEVRLSPGHCVEESDLAKLEWNYRETLSEPVHVLGPSGTPGSVAWMNPRVYYWRGNRLSSNRGAVVAAAGCASTLEISWS